MKKIDFHCHVTLNRLEGLHTDDASPKHLSDVMERYDIEKAVVMATYFPHQNKGMCNAKMLDMLRGRDEFLLFGSLDVENNLNAGVRELETLTEKKSIAGIKLYPGYQDFYPHEKALFPIYQLALDNGLPVAFHSGETTGEGDFPESWDIDDDYPKNYVCYQTYPAHIGEVADRFPSLRLIICHYGQPFTKATRDVLGKFPHVYTDLSGLWKTGKDDTPKEVRHTRKALKTLAEECDTRRILFASDFPIQSIEDSIAHIESMGLSEKDKKKIYYENAAELLKP